MKTNSIHFWFVESEFIVKNEFHNWTSELGCIWHIFGKLGYFWLFLSAPFLMNWRSPYSQNTMVSFEYIDFWPNILLLGPTIFKIPQPNWYYMYLITNILFPIYLKLSKMMRAMMSDAKDKVYPIL